MTTELKAVLRLDAAAKRPAEIAVAATEAERAAIAARLDLARIEALTLDARLARLPAADLYEATGEARMSAERTCVVSLEPFVEETTATFREILTTDPALVSDADEAADPEESDVELVEGETVDFGEIALQYLAMALDPYPRGPDAEAAEAEAEAAMKDEGDGTARRPFAGLDRLLGGRGDSG